MNKSRIKMKILSLAKMLRAQIIAAMLFGMFIAILNQTLLNVALPRINTEFNISASTGQWLMTGFMLVNGILIPISAFYSINILIVNCLLSRLLGSLVCAISTNFPIMMTGRIASHWCWYINATWI